MYLKLIVQLKPNILCMCFIERSVTSHTHGSKISGSQQYWSFSNNQPWQQQESLDWQNNNLFTSITLFCPFLNHHCTTATWNFFILRAHLLECMNIHVAEKFPFSFLNLDNYGLLDSTSENFASIIFNIWKIKWNFLNKMYVFSLLSSRNFATMAMWHTLL